MVTQFQGRPTDGEVAQRTVGRLRESCLHCQPLFFYQKQKNKTYAATNHNTMYDSPTDQTVCPAGYANCNQMEPSSTPILHCDYATPNYRVGDPGICYYIQLTSPKGKCSV